MKLSFTLLLGLIVTLLLTNVSWAAGGAVFSLSSVGSPIEVGKQFTVNLNINPGTSSVDTARAHLSFSADLITATGFALNGRITSPSPGNRIDSGAGTVSWGAFTVDTPIISPSSFGQISFIAKAAGTAAIKILSDSKLIDDGNEVSNPGGFNQITVEIIPSTTNPSVIAQLTSPTHPDQDKWYQNNNVQFQWTGITGGHYAWDFDQSPDTIPTKSTTDRTKKITGVKNGTWYFHLAKSPVADADAVIHYRVQIDSLKPNPIEPYLDIGNQENLVLKFATTDYHSGVASYAIKVNQESTIENVISPYTLRGLNIGSNLITVTVYDQAGNPRTGWVKFALKENGTIEDIKVSGNVSGVCALIPTLCDRPWVPITTGGASIALLTSVVAIRRRRLNLLNMKKVIHTDVGTVAKTTTRTDPKTGKKLITKTVTKTDTKDIVETDSGIVAKNGVGEDGQETKQEGQREDKRKDNEHHQT